MHEMMNYTSQMLYGIAIREGGRTFYIRLESGMYEVRAVHYPPCDIPDPRKHKVDLDNPWADNFFWPCVHGRATKLDTAMLICSAESKNFVSAYWWSPSDENQFDSWTCKCHRVNIFKLGDKPSACDNCGREEINGRVGVRASQRIIGAGRSGES